MEKVQDSEKSVAGSENYEYTHWHRKKDFGEVYDRILYREDTYSNRIWGIEKYILSQIMEGRAIHKYIDFACGTGRVIQFVEPHVRHAIGMDISRQMLETAEKKLVCSKLVMLDILDHNVDTSEYSNSDLITVFRFILNADPGLRSHILKKLGSLLSGDGRIVFNVHGNKHSIRYIYVLMYNFLKRVKLLAQGKESSGKFFFTQLSVGEIEALISEANLKLDRIYSYGFLPSLLANVLPQKLWQRIERRLVTTTLLVGTHLMCVCRRGV